LKNKIKSLIVKGIGGFLELQFKFSPNRAIINAFQLFCKPQKGRVQTHQESFLNEARYKVEEIEEHHLQVYCWEGKDASKTICFFHGWNSNTYRWRQLVERFQALGYTIYAIDAPAHGYSQGKYLNIVLYSKCIAHMVSEYQPQVIIGHSIGAMASILYQSNNPTSSLNKVVALGPPSELHLFFKDFQQKLGLSSSFMEALYNYVFECFGFNVNEFSIAEFSKKLHVDGLLVLDKEDPLAPYSYSEKIAVHWKKAQLITVEGVGHSLQSEAIFDQIVNFVRLELV